MYERFYGKIIEFKISEIALIPGILTRGIQVAIYCKISIKAELWMR